VQSHILVWSGDEPLEIGWNGDVIYIPPMREVAKPGIGSPYRLPSAKNRDGVMLPGTILVEDVIVTTQSGGYKKIFDVSDLCAFLERDMPQLFKRGFQIVSDPEDVRIVQTECRPLYEVSQDDRARSLLAEELQRRKKYEDSGQPAPPGSNAADVEWAIRHQKLRQSQRRKAGVEYSTEDIYSALAGTFDPAALADEPEAAAPAPPSVQPVAPEAPLRVSGASMIDEADELSVNLTKADLAGLIRGDKETYEYIREKLDAKISENEEKAKKVGSAA
jgi:hypothetical protein